MSNTHQNLSLQFLIQTSSERQTKDQRNRINLFVEWSNAHGYTASNFNLRDYQSYLINQQGFAPNSVKAHLSSIRAYLRGKIKDKSLQQELYTLIDQNLPHQERQAIVDALVNHILLQITVNTPTVKVPSSSPRNINLCDQDINNLLDNLRPDSPQSLRDTAVIALMAVTGIRENELCAIEIGDIRQHSKNNLGLHVPPGRGCTERIVPYLDNEWVLDIIDTWLAFAKITKGPVFRGFYKSNYRIRETHLSPSAVERLLANYPILLNGELAILKPLDIRHAYTGHLFRDGIDLEVIREYLGLKRIQTVWDYIGKRRDTQYEEYRFELSRLSYWHS